MDKITEARKDTSRIERIAAGTASTKDFVAMGLPFEAFLRYAQMTPAQMAHVADVMRQHFAKP